MFQGILVLDEDSILNLVYCSDSYKRNLFAFFYICYLFTKCIMVYTGFGTAFLGYKIGVFTQQNNLNNLDPSDIL